MKNYAQKTVIIFLIVLCAFLVSCKKQNPDPNGPDVTVSSAPDDKEDPKATTYAIPDSTGASKISYYSVDSSGKITRANSLIADSTEITPELILGYFTDSLEDESIIVDIESVTVKNGICRISFDDSIYDVASLGKQVESAVLDAAAQSILDNIEEVTGVSYCIDGKEYSTKNFTFVLDSVYMGK